jgi:cholesterol 7-desaturase
MPLRFLVGVGAIHVFPILNEKYLHLEHFKDREVVYPETHEFAIFLVVCAVALVLRDSSPWIGSSSVFINDSRRAELEKKPSKYYSTMSVPQNSFHKHWVRQLFYDLAVYTSPLVALAVGGSPFFPTAPLLVDAVLVLLSLAVPLYDFMVTRVFLRSSDRESAERAEFRLKSYPYTDTVVNSWFRLCNSAELPPGKCIYVQAQGNHYALFRGEDNVVRCIDAYCVHMGANIAIGGKVVGNCVECPFHKWQFDGSGACTHIPYQEKIPPQTGMRAYHVCEYYGVVLVWHSHAPLPSEERLKALGETAATYSSPPEYFPPRLERLDCGDMVHRGQREMTINMHIREFAENSTDYAHFDPLHGRLSFPFIPHSMPFVTVNHIPGWKAGREEDKEKHICWFYDTADLSFFGVRQPATKADAVITFVGPGGVVFFSFDTPLGRILLLQTHTPETPMRLRTSFTWYASASMPRMLVWYIVGNWIAQWQNDIFVWENKLFAQ